MAMATKVKPNEIPNINGSLSNGVEPLLMLISSKAEAKKMSNDAP